MCSQGEKKWKFHSVNLWNSFNSEDNGKVLKPFYLHHQIVTAFNRPDNDLKNQIILCWWCFWEYLKSTNSYQLFCGDGSAVSDVVGASDGIIPGGAGKGIGFIISSSENFGITFRSWLCPWWLKPWVCCWTGCFPAAADVDWGKDFGSCDFEESVFSAFHLSFNAFNAICLRRSLSCWSDGEIDMVSERMSLELEWLRGIIGWCFTKPMFKLNLYTGFTRRLMTGCIAVGKKLENSHVVKLHLMSLSDKLNTYLAKVKLSEFVPRMPFPWRW